MGIYGRFGSLLFRVLGRFPESHAVAHTSPWTSIGHLSDHANGSIVEKKRKHEND